MNKQWFSKLHLSNQDLKRKEGMRRTLEDSLAGNSKQKFKEVEFLSLVTTDLELFVLKFDNMLLVCKGFFLIWNLKQNIQYMCCYHHPFKMNSNNNHMRYKTPCGVGLGRFPVSSAGA